MNNAIYGQLKIFHLIAQEKSLSAAARKLNMAIPSVSQALKQLEEQIGAPLFHRTTRKIDLTDLGKTLLHSTQPLVQSLETAVENVQFQNEQLSGNIRLTVPRFAYLLIIQPHYAEFCRRYPHIQLEIHVDDEMVDLAAQKFDIGIRFVDRIMRDMVARKLLPEMKMGFFASSDFLAEHGKPDSVEAFAALPFIGYRFATSQKILPLVVEQQGKKSTLTINYTLITNDLDQLLHATRQGFGVLQTLEPLRNLQPDPENFEPLLPEYWETYPATYLYYFQHSTKIKRIKAFVDFLLEKMG
nr:LysR family transcriptional regulator [uncultured Aggregatibacter sp.]